MTIEESIKYLKRVAESKYEEGMLCNARSRDDISNICIKWAKTYEQIAEWLKELQQYHAIGTVEECREARERQSIKKPYWRQEEGAEGYACPCCDMGVVDANGIRDTYCHSCGQHLDWSDSD